ncbi:MAG TPA: hypothetical protein VJ464_29215 [Blastocatellia bacterium]|nr:hypothetical protein [Blastocatellia bacterium]
MKQLAPARLIAIRSLLMTALYAHLLIAGFAAGGPAPVINSSAPIGFNRLKAATTRDCLIAPRPGVTLSLRLGSNRSDHFIAALSPPLIWASFAEQPAPCARRLTARAGGCLLPTASRAPPPLIA